MLIEQQFNAFNKTVLWPVLMKTNQLNLIYAKVTTAIRLLITLTHSIISRIDPMNNILAINVTGPNNSLLKGSRYANLSKQEQQQQQRENEERNQVQTKIYRRSQKPRNGN